MSWQRALLAGSARTASVARDLLGLLFRPGVFLATLASIAALCLPSLACHRLPAVPRLPSLACRRYPYEHMTVITGVGRHSKNQQARIRPAVRKFLQDAGHRFDEVRDGCFRVHIRRVR